METLKLRPASELRAEYERKVAERKALAKVEEEKRLMDDVIASIDVAHANDQTSAIFRLLPKSICDVLTNAGYIVDNYSGDERRERDDTTAVSW